MKRTLLALALLVPAFASASVKLDVSARCNEDTHEESVTLSVDDSYTLPHEESNSSTEVVLVKETAEAATLRIVVKHGDDVKSDNEITVEYGKETKLECSDDSVDAELSITVSQLSVAEVA